MVMADDNDADDVVRPSKFRNLDEEFIRLKLELAQARAAADSARLRARQLISNRDSLRDNDVKNRAEMEEKQRIIEQTRESNEKLAAQVKIAAEEQVQLLMKIEESDKWTTHVFEVTLPNQKRLAHIHNSCLIYERRDDGAHGGTIDLVVGEHGDDNVIKWYNVMPIQKGKTEPEGVDQVTDVPAEHLLQRKRSKNI